MKVLLSLNAYIKLIKFNEIGKFLFLLYAPGTDLHIYLEVGIMRRVDQLRSLDMYRLKVFITALCIPLCAKWPLCIRFMRQK